MIEAIVLCGGLGKRLRSAVPDTQKVVANVQERPFIFYIIDELIRQKVRDFILCLGYRSTDVIDLVEREYKHHNINFHFSVEDYPLGTGGAVKLALKYCRGTRILILNGDTFNEFNLKNFTKFHEDESNKITMLVKKISNVARYGSVTVDKELNIQSFNEKTLNNNQAGLINAGIYLIEKNILEKINENAFSFEKSVLPEMIDKNFKAVISEGTFIDIGIPEDLKKAASIRLKV